MVSNLFFYQLALIALLWLCLLLHYVWPSDRAAIRPTSSALIPPRRKRRRDLKSFEGLTKKPYCDACAHTSASHPQAPCAAPPRIMMTRGRRRQIDTSTHFYPNPDCA
jgi:hypothetical protein